MTGTIQLAGIGKAYKRYHRRAHQWIEVLTLGRVRRSLQHWVLRDITLNIAAGEAVGLVGYNGAGKSTLLKIISGVAQPSAGQARITGRVSAILELGVGFHFDLTGRQNIPLAGQLMGLTPAEIGERTDSVIAFADLGDMIDQPLRAYSSGMVARLAFAVATAHRPDILIVDEALSVGDAYFQHKSFQRIREFQQAGSTILFVSHDFGAVRTLCNRVVLLGEGQVLRDGTAAEVLDYYNALIAERENGSGIQQLTHDDGRSLTRSGTGAARLIRVELKDQAGTPALRFATGDPLAICINASTTQPLDSLVAGFMIRDRSGNPVYGSNSWHLHQPLLRLAAGIEAEFVFQMPLNLGSGSYSLSVALVDSDSHVSHNYDWQDNLLVFEVVNLHCPSFVGLAYLPAHVAAKRIYPAWDLNRYGARSYSQFGEDGILRHIFEVIGCTNRYCLEFGGYDGLAMSNTARLLREDGWQGAFIEADPDAFAKLQTNYRDHPNVRAVQAFVNPDNIESLLSQLDTPQSFDLLSIDIDGNDYWVWQAITRWQPRVVIAEVNGAYPPPRKWVMRYNPAHSWQGNDYYGASAQSLTDLARTKGYELVCGEEQGSNLVFVKARYLPCFNIPDNRVETLFRPPRYGLPEHGWGHPHTEGAHEVL